MYFQTTKPVEPAGVLVKKATLENDRLRDNPIYPNSDFYCDQLNKRITPCHYREIIPSHFSTDINFLSPQHLTSTVYLLIN
jgi:hypothetical protein